MQSNINFDFPKMTKNWHKSRIYQKWPLDDLRWPWRLKLTTNHQINIFIWFLDPKNILKMVSFVILTFFIFPIWPPAAILNFSKRSIVTIGHQVRNWSSDTILQESSVKKNYISRKWVQAKKAKFCPDYNGNRQKSRVVKKSIFFIKIN